MDPMRSYGGKSDVDGEDNNLFAHSGSFCLLNSIHVELVSFLSAVGALSPTSVVFHMCADLIIITNHISEVQRNTNVAVFHSLHHLMCSLDFKMTVRFKRGKTGCNSSSVQ